MSKVSRGSQEKNKLLIKFIEYFHYNLKNPESQFEKFLKISGKFADKLPMLNLPNHNRIRVRAPTPSIDSNILRVNVFTILN